MPNDMKATLKFDLDDLDDRLAHLRCVHALELTLVITDLQEYLREEIKYKDNESLEPVRDELNKILYGREINLEELIR